MSDRELRGKEQLGTHIPNGGNTTRLVCREREISRLISLASELQGSFTERVDPTE